MAKKTDKPQLSWEKIISEFNQNDKDLQYQNRERITFEKWFFDNYTVTPK